jgi:glycosyltransferase involved in cell wall biosynthesis
VDHEYASAGFGARLEATLKTARPDLVHVDSLDLHKWLDRVGAVPVACTHHSIESELLQLRGDHHGSFLLRPYLRIQAGRYLALERLHTPRFAVNVMMSELDASRLRAIAPGARTVSIPNGVDPAAIRPGSEAEVDPDLVAFLGPAYMYPNRDGMEYFLEEIWPAVLAARPSTRLAWIGRMSPGDRERFGRHPRLRCLGFVEDLERQLASAACLVVPLRIGGGTRLKILDAWAAAKAVVSTSVGCEGLGSEDGGNILVRDDSKAFADAIIRVLDEPDLRRRLGTAARRTVEEGYSWSAIGDKLNREYSEILAD